MYWYEKETLGNTPVLSTRVRFARNLENTPFPAKLTPQQRGDVFRTVKEAFEDKDYIFVDFGEADSILKEAYVQTHLASPALLRRGAGSGLILSREGDVSVMVNEEDHLRIQVIRAGKEIRSTFEKAIFVARYAEEKLPFAFREKLGYLTACPTNLGAAMRLSVMIHLPAVTELGGMADLTRRLNDAGFTVRGLFGEGSREGGAIYQISNQMSREKTPEEIVSSFETVLGQVEEAEYRAGKALLSRDPVALEDRVSRALGTLRYAKMMSYSELIRLYSTLRLGKVLDLEVCRGVRGLDRLLIELMPAPMQVLDRTLSEDRERDRKRSERLREKLSE